MYTGCGGGCKSIHVTKLYVTIHTQRMTIKPREF